jgi:hypothetical protein
MEGIHNQKTKSEVNTNAHRKFYDIPEHSDSLTSTRDDKIKGSIEDTTAQREFFNYISNSEIGNEQTFQTPFGQRKGIQI